MTKELTTINAQAISSKMPPYSREADDIVTYCMSASERTGNGLVLRNWPTDAARGRLRQRQHELMKGLKDHDRGTIAALISDMLSAYDVAKQQNKTKREKQETITKYVQELAGVPTWAVARACEAIRLGQAPDISHAFTPTTIQVRVLAVSIAERVKSEAIKINEIMRAERYVEPVTPEERAAVGDQLRELAQECRTRIEPSQDAPEVIRAGMMKKFNLSDADWSKIPDAPRNSKYWDGIREVADKVLTNHGGGTR